MATSISIDWSSDDAPLQVVRQLRGAGFEAWLAGGCVRDLLLRRTPKDFDVATSATPDQVATVFRRTIPVQTELGVTMVLWKESRLEVTTFRTEGPYLDGRRPIHVGPADSKGDVQRRDFTINGLLLDPETGDVVDHVGGIQDLRQGILRCIGNPDDRFGEDHLRILRAVRFAVRFDLELESSTWQAMGRLSSHLPRLAGERIRDEFERMFSVAPFARCLDLLQDCGAFTALLPELARSLEDHGTRQRMTSLFSRIPPPLPGLWTALLGIPMAPWWETPFEETGSTGITAGQERILQLLKSSRAECEASRLIWARWREAWKPLPRPLSHMASLVRDRSFASFLEAVRWFEAAHAAAPWRASEALDEELHRIPRSLPAVGGAFQKLGIAPGPLLGKAVRLLDQRHLDEARPVDESLLREVALTILGGA